MSTLQLYLVAKEFSLTPACIPAEIKEADKQGSLGLHERALKSFWDTHHPERLMAA